MWTRFELKGELKREEVTKKESEEDRTRGEEERSRGEEVEIGVRALVDPSSVLWCLLLSRTYLRHHSTFL